MIPTVLSVAVAGALLCFGLRRLAFLVAALLPLPDEHRDDGELPHVSLVVAARNEEATIPGLLTALENLDYPADRLRIVLVDDASTDNTFKLLGAWAAERSNVKALALDRPDGKFAALAEGAPRDDPAIIIAVCDADMRPAPRWLRQLVAPFNDARVGAVGAYVFPANARMSFVARYAAAESWVHQLITSAGKDRLGLDPPTMGACAYRRTALQEVGWFRPVVAGEDVRLSAALSREGWRVRFSAHALVGTNVVSTWTDYWRQHLRWGRNLLAMRSRADSASQKPRVRQSVLRTIERLLTSAGYADRGLVVAGLVLALVGPLPLWVPLAYLMLPGVELLVGVAKGGSARELPLFFMSALIVFPLDALASIVALSAHGIGAQRRWRQAPRTPRGGA